MIEESDHLGIAPWDLFHEEQQAYYYGLNGETPDTFTIAEFAGFGHRVGDQEVGIPIYEDGEARMTPGIFI